LDLLYQALTPIFAFKSLYPRSLGTFYRILASYLPNASPFSLKCHPQLRVGVTAVARTLASVPTVAASLLPKELKSRRRKRANLIATKERLIQF
jgi:hypothetical protein